MGIRLKGLTESECAKLVCGKFMHAWNPRSSPPSLTYKVTLHTHLMYFLKLNHPNFFLLTQLIAQYFTLQHKLVSHSVIFYVQHFGQKNIIPLKFTGGSFIVFGWKQFLLLTLYCISFRPRQFLSLTKELHFGAVSH